EEDQRPEEGRSPDEPAKSEEAAEASALGVDGIHRVFEVRSLQEREASLDFGGVMEIQIRESLKDIRRPENPERSLTEAAVIIENHGELFHVVWCSL